MGLFSMVLSTRGMTPRRLARLSGKDTKFALAPTADRCGFAEKRILFKVVISPGRRLNIIAFGLFGKREGEPSLPRILEAAQLSREEVGIALIDL